MMTGISNDGALVKGLSERGKTNDEIASILDISIKQVYRHLYSLGEGV